MTRKPAEVVRAIKAKVAAVRTSRAQPKAKPELQGSEAPVVAPEAVPHPPQGAPWRCLVCGNEATGDVCPVDGNTGKP